MNISNYRKTLIAAGVATALGIGAAGCSESTDDYVADERATETPPAETTVSPAAETSDESDMASGDTDEWATTSDDNDEWSDDSDESAMSSDGNAEVAMSDTWITTEIKAALLADTDAKGLDVDVDTSNGVVTLEGELSSQDDIDHVKTLVTDVDGVKRVNATALIVAHR